MSSRKLFIHRHTSYTDKSLLLCGTTRREQEEQKVLLQEQQ